MMQDAHKAERAGPEWSTHRSTAGQMMEATPARCSTMNQRPPARGSRDAQSSCSCQPPRAHSGPVPACNVKAIFLGAQWICMRMPYAPATRHSCKFQLSFAAQRNKHSHSRARYTQLLRDAVFGAAARQGHLLRSPGQEHTLRSRPAAPHYCSTQLAQAAIRQRQHRRAIAAVLTLAHRPRPRVSCSSSAMN